MSDYKSRMCLVSQKKVRPVIHSGMVPPCSCVFFPSVLPFPLDKAPSVGAIPFTGLPAVAPGLLPAQSCGPQEGACREPPSQTAALVTARCSH